MACAVLLETRAKLPGNKWPTKAMHVSALLAAKSLWEVKDTPLNVVIKENWAIKK